MRWLFVARLRPFVLLAAAASLLLNLALLMPSIYMMQVFDRVFSSRSMETLVMLSVLAVLALALGYCMMSCARLHWPGRGVRSIGGYLQRRLRACCAKPPGLPDAPTPTCCATSRSCARS
ncbi:MAG: hypothetical protein ABI612_10415 [Betaproteobacteria bacterium]